MTEEQMTRVALNGFALGIRGGTDRGDGYAQLRHGQRYQILLQNDTVRRCDVTIAVDGKHIGTFRLNSSQSIWLERPGNDTGYFTFYEVGTPEADKIGMVPGLRTNGVVEAVFAPEKLPANPVATVLEPSHPHGKAMPDYLDSRDWTDNIQYASRSYYPLRAGASASGDMVEGITGLSGRSNQEFQTVPPLNTDERGTVKIAVRLVGRDPDPRPLKSMTPAATERPAPPPVGRK